MCIRDRRRGRSGRRLERHVAQNGLLGLVLEVDVLEHDASPVSYTHLRAHETVLDLVCRLLLEKKQQQHNLYYRESLYHIITVP